MINKETIISVYDEKLTLLQWLKSVNKALDEAVLTNVEIEQRGNATFVFVFTFEDGTRVESNEIIVNQGESINGASIRNGHLYLTLTNGDELDAGNVKPVSSFTFNTARHLIVSYGDGTTQDLGLIKGVSSFSIDANQHLIVHYDNNTTEDLGAIFSGNISISGNITATGTIHAPIVDGDKVTGDEIVETMTGYSNYGNANEKITLSYKGVCKNGNKISFVWAGSISTGEDGVASYSTLGLSGFIIPSEVGGKIFPVYSTAVDAKAVTLFKAGGVYIPSSIYGVFHKDSAGFVRASLSTGSNSLSANETYYFRYEATFLLSDNMVS